MPIKLTLVAFTACAAKLLSQPTPESDSVAIQDALSKLLLTVRSVEEPSWTRLLAPTADKITTLGLLRELKQHMRPTSHRPMSELSTPILLVRLESLDTPERAGACVSVTRFGSVVGETLAVYGLIAAKTGKEWRIVSLSSTASCHGALLFTPSPIQRADTPEKQVQAP